MDTTATIRAVRQWPVEDQLELVFNVWDHIVDSGAKPGLDEDLKAELNRRLAAFRADPSRGFTWEQVVSHVRRTR